MSKSDKIFIAVIGILIASLISVLIYLASSAPQFILVSEVEVKNLAYAYYSSVPVTNEFGGVYDYDKYLNIGIITEDNSVINEVIDKHDVPKIMLGDKNEVVIALYCREYEDGSKICIREGIQKIYLTKDASWQLKER